MYWNASYDPNDPNSVAYAPVNYQDAVYDLKIPGKLIDTAENGITQGAAGGAFMMMYIVSNGYSLSGDTQGLLNRHGFCDVG